MKKYLLDILIVVIAIGFLVLVVKHLKVFQLFFPSQPEIVEVESKPKTELYEHTIKGGSCLIGLAPNGNMAIACVEAK